MSFADNLNTLPEIAGKRVRLHDAHGVECGVIENAPGTGGSFRLYAYLAQQYGSITPEAAAVGIPANIPISTACWRVSPRTVG